MRNFNEVKGKRPRKAARKAYAATRGMTYEEYMAVAPIGNGKPDICNCDFLQHMEDKLNEAIESNNSPVTPKKVRQSGLSFVSGGSCSSK